MLDPVILAGLALVMLFALWRLRSTYRSARKRQVSDIRSKLEELRKKRDEE